MRGGGRSDEFVVRALLAACPGVEGSPWTTLPRTLGTLSQLCAVRSRASFCRGAFTDPFLLRPTSLRLANVSFGLSLHHPPPTPGPHLRHLSFSSVYFDINLLAQLRATSFPSLSTLSWSNIDMVGVLTPVALPLPFLPRIQAFTALEPLPPPSPRPPSSSAARQLTSTPHSCQRRFGSCARVPPAANRPLPTSRSIWDTKSYRSSTYSSFCLGNRWSR